MTFEDFWNVVFLLGIIAAIVFAYRQQKKREQMFRACAERLGLCDLRQTARSIEGNVRGMGLDVRFVDGSKNTPSHMTVDVTFAPCALLLHLRRQNKTEEQAVRAGEALDVVLGDPAFDSAWILEGAPAPRVVRLLSDLGLRARLMAFSTIEDASVKIEDGNVSLYRRGTDLKPDEINTKRIELALALAESARAEAETPLESGEIDSVGSNYRKVKRFDLDASGPEKIAELKVLRANRALNQIRVASLVTNGVVTTIVVLSQFASSPPPFVITAPLLLIGLIANLVFLSWYSKERHNAPGVLHDTVMLGVMGGCWIVNIAMALRAWSILI